MRSFMQLGLTTDWCWRPRFLAKASSFASTRRPFAKCVVVDEARALVTSANFSDIERGVLIEIRALRHASSTGGAASSTLVVPR